MAVADSHLNQVSRAIATIRTRFDWLLRIEDIANAAGMSSSSLHEHFKAMARMTPLEYQKQLRLQEACRLMLSGGSAGFAVGYEAHRNLIASTPACSALLPAVTSHSFS
jgi:AraC-like DNA-binding protein